MKPIRAIIYRYLTDNDFFTIYKPPRTESRGGGQLYIDFLTSEIPTAKWRRFFQGVTGIAKTRVANGPQWEFPVHSIGLAVPPQTLRVYQRRAASICIPNQNINTRGANRVNAWAPGNGFPAPQNTADRHAAPTGLVVFLARTTDNEVWAGWLLNNAQLGGIPVLLQSAFVSPHEQGDVGYVECDGGVLLAEGNAAQPFSRVEGSADLTVMGAPHPRSGTHPQQGRPSSRHAGARRTVPPRQRTEQEVIESLFGEDEMEPGEQSPETRQAIINIRRRNQGAVRDLKELYNHRCQITGVMFTFIKRDGLRYVEAHHLIPLGEGGADDPRNMIIVNPLLHRMLHYANVTGVDLSRIVEHQDGTATLAIAINGDPYTITWHREHAMRVSSHQPPGP